MENIKDMNILEFDDDFKLKKETSINELMKDPHIMKILQQYHLDRTIIEDNWAEFLDYQDDLNKCQHCQGLDFCVKVTQGMQHYLEIINNEVIISSMPCQYGKELLEKKDILSRIPVRNVSEKIVLVTPKDIQGLSASDEDAVKKVYGYILEPKNHGFIIQGPARSGKSTLAGFLIRNLAKPVVIFIFLHFYWI